MRNTFNDQTKACPAAAKTWIDHALHSSGLEGLWKEKLCSGIVKEVSVGVKS